METDRHTDTQTDTQTKYRNPRCACARRGLTTPRMLQKAPQSVLNFKIFLGDHAPRPPPTLPLRGIPVFGGFAYANACNPPFQQPAYGPDVTRATWSVLKSFNTTIVAPSYRAMSCNSVEPETVLPVQESSHACLPVLHYTARSLSGKVSSLTTKLGLPSQALERIAEKATELLEAEGSIVSAPGYSAEAEIVKSHSGKRPHLVTPKKKGGGYVCDDDCPQYKSAKLCSHTLATAVANDNLDSFIASYARVKRVPNLTELATTAMPKGRGRKGAKAPTKRKPNAPIQSRFELNPSTDLPGPSVQVGVSSSSNTSVSIHAPSYSESGVLGGGTPTQIAGSSNKSFFSMPPSMPTWSPLSCYPADPTSGGVYPTSSPLHFRKHFSLPWVQRKIPESCTTL